MRVRAEVYLTGKKMQIVARGSGSALRHTLGFSARLSGPTRAHLPGAHLHTYMAASTSGAERNVQDLLLASLDRVCVASKGPRLLSVLLAHSLHSYLEQNPTSIRAVQALQQAQLCSTPDSIAHDHFAYRTIGLPGLGISSLASVLEELGFRMQDDSLRFPAKKLKAAWFSHESGKQRGGPYVPPVPRIFASEIQVEKLSPAAQEVMTRHVAGLNLGPAQVATAMISGELPWQHPSDEDYDLLAKESEYAAWVLQHGYALNHTALSTHWMRPSGAPARGVAIREVAACLQGAGLKMNPDGGILKTSPDGLLIQCSTLSDIHDNRAGCYIEFAERLPLAQGSRISPGAWVPEAERRDGFEVNNADRIFTSTTVAGAAK